MAIIIEIKGNKYKTHESLGVWQVRRVDLQKRKLHDIVFPKPEDYDEKNGEWYNSERIEKFISENTHDELIEKYHFDCCFMPMNGAPEISVLLDEYLPSDLELTNMAKHVDFFVQSIKDKKEEQLRLSASSG